MPKYYITHPLTEDDLYNPAFYQQNKKEFFLEGFKYRDREGVVRYCNPNLRLDGYCNNLFLNTVNKLEFPILITRFNFESKGGSYEVPANIKDVFPELDFYRVDTESQMMPYVLVDTMVQIAKAGKLIYTRQKKKDNNGDIIDWIFDTSCINGMSP